MRNILKTIILIIIFNSNLFSEENIYVKNVHFRYLNGKIFINYELVGLKDVEYEVSIYLKRAGDSLYLYEPKFLTGKVGDGILAGKDQQIIWDISKESTNPFSGEDYYFQINARIAKGSNLMLWLGGGAAVIGGVAVIIIKPWENKTTSTPITTDQGFPKPVGRP